MRTAQFEHVVSGHLIVKFDNGLGERDATNEDLQKFGLLNRHDASVEIREAIFEALTRYAGHDERKGIAFAKLYPLYQLIDLVLNPDSSKLVGVNRDEVMSQVAAIELELRCGSIAANALLEATNVD